ncbi:MAG: CpXC domain-containing protein [Spirochaetales bacterium]|nr:CpXC domain-containing protein [Spirochaetales bacterium]
MKKITCYCEEIFDADIPDEVDLDKNPETITAIIDGKFMSITCPRCGKLLKPEYPFKLFSNSSGINLFFIPELDRSPYLLGKLEYSIGTPDRVVIGYRELVEKISIYKEKLDDRIIETIKYYLMKKAVETSNNEEADIDVYFHEKKSGTFIFHIEGLKLGEIAETKIKKDMYDKIAKDIDQKIKSDPFKAFLSPPYVSIKRIYIENE